MAISMGTGGSIGSSWMAAAGRRRKNAGAVFAAGGSASGLTEQYRTLRLQPGASEKEVKQAFRRLALQYHPDVCKGSNCGVQFHRINEAYDVVMSNLRALEQEEEELPESWQSQEWYGDYDEPLRGMYDSSWDLWEEWMGWEGGGIRDYSSHINPYI
ncbi:Chaperone protein dnaJ 8, chloroplastic [Apostasia shenzhenica]|uniref:Chaperone protein dnaJ 8, chloroplastic n=1 Tax=Apostasia shenzhenica TaxID=1088818 RepID=A0A2I0B821_9ASPA|nr:Chaperone protein dnaJ 8, chloroplastic [Apostasia shenzhenica]